MWGGNVHGQFQKLKFAGHVRRKLQRVEFFCFVGKLGGRGFHGLVGIRGDRFGVFGNKIFRHPGSTPALDPQV